MEENKSILHELYVFSEWKPEPEYIQKPDNILPENISTLWRWFKFFGPKKSLIDSIAACKERQQKWHIALGDEGKVIAVLTDNILEIRTKRSEYATIAARTTVSRDAYPQWRKLVWSPDCSFLAMAYGNGVVSFFDLTASNLFNIPADCTRPGGLECTDNTHAVADIIFMPLRVKDNKWNWEVLVVTYDGRIRGFLISVEGCELHHSFSFPGGAGTVVHCSTHATLLVAGLPRAAVKDPSSPLSAGITAWRILNEAPWYKLSVVSDQLETQLANQGFQFYVPFASAKNLAFIVQMVVSPDNSKLVCLHCNGDVTVWRLPLLKLLHRYPLPAQPQCDLQNPLVKQENDALSHHASDVSWWSDEEVILSRFSGAVSVCNIENMINILGKKPEFFQGAPRVTMAHAGTFMVLECESNVLPSKRARSDDSLEMVQIEPDTEDTMLDLTRELFKSVMFAITDMETFQPRPKRVTVVARVYRLLGVRSTTPQELFSRKIESGNYTEALALAEEFGLDSDLVYQQQWRKNPVSTDAIQKYLSKVSKKIWAVHQCVDRLPETLPAAKELLHFGLKLTNEEILNEINKDREEKIDDPDLIELSDLNAYTSELLRCRHVMLFYRQRVSLYEAILRCEKSTYVKDEYDRLRANSLVHSSVELAKEGRISALACLWPHIPAAGGQLAVLASLPETSCPRRYRHLLPAAPGPARRPSPRPEDCVGDWCRKEGFRSIWSSNWSEDSSPDTETAANDDISQWYEKRAREIEAKSGLASHALTLATIAAETCGVTGLDSLIFHLLTLDVLLYDLNVEGVTLEQLEKLSALETCGLLMKMSTPKTFVADLKQFVIPFLKRYETLTKRADCVVQGLMDYLESVSVDDLSSILLVLQSPNEFELDVRTHLDLAEKCLYAYNGTEQLDKACDLLDTILKETDGSISESELIRRCAELEKLVAASSLINWRGVRVTVQELKEMPRDKERARMLLARVARDKNREEKWSQQEWEKLLKDLLELQSTLLNCVSKEEVYEIYASSLLTSGDEASIKLASTVLSCGGATRLVPPARSAQLVAACAREYFNSSGELREPALQRAKCALSLIQDENEEIQKELDLIASLEILSAFNLDILPIQVRLCEDRLTLIEKCLQSDPNAYMASSKLLKLAKLLRVAGDDDHAREGQVLQLVASAAVAAGAGGCAAAAAAARRLAALRCAPAAPLLAHVAKSAHAHADTDARRALYAAAATYADPKDIEQILKDRLSLELEGLQQTAAAAREHASLVERWPSTDDEFVDAITTPVIEKKDLVAAVEKKVPLFNYLLDTFQNKFSGGGDTKPQPTDASDHSIYCQEFYRTLYPEHKTSDSYYTYSTFSVPSPHEQSQAQAVLKWYYVQNCLDNSSPQLEGEVVQKVAEELLNKDTALSVACLLRSARDSRLWKLRHSRAAVSAALYANVLECSAPELRDNVYLTKPKQLARMTLEGQTASDEQMEVIRRCLAKLSGCGEVEQIKALGVNVNGLLFSADPDYRQEIVYRLARSPNPEHLELACSLASKYDLDALEVWLQHADSDPTLASLLSSVPCGDATTHTRICEGLWPKITGSNHHALINFFTILKNVDEKPLLWGLTAAEHIKLLKKVKAASNELDYKILLEPASEAEFTSHILSVMRPETAGMVTKLLRTLPPAFRLPLPVHTLYTVWLTHYFYSEPSTGSVSNKKWMQRYRQCASYFNKLAKKELLRFLADTCFSPQALQRVPAGTRSLMLMQAVDYCQQEQENDFKFTKDELSWTQVGQELTRWARFLENYHSDTIQGIVGNGGVSRHEIWPEIEQSHGDPTTLVPLVGRLVLGGLGSAALGTLLQCLHVAADAAGVLRHLADNSGPRCIAVPLVGRLVLGGLGSAALGTLLQCLHVAADAAGVLRHLADNSGPSDIPALVTRIIQYHKEGIKLPEDLIETVMAKATEAGLPPHKQIGLLALSDKGKMEHTGDVAKVARYTVDLIKTEFGNEEYAEQLTEEQLMTDGGRRQALTQLLELADTFARRKALVDVVNCWPPSRDSESRSIQFLYLQNLLSDCEQHEARVVIKLLLRRPQLTPQEVKLLTSDVSGESIVSALWVVLLAKSDREQLLYLANKHKNYLSSIVEIEDDLIKELLDNDYFTAIVPTPLYSAAINYIVGSEAADNAYSIEWAVAELRRRRHSAEAGQLQLMAVGVPAALRGFTQSVLYCRNLFKN
ncbi:LOW QUALITY PROTEIN: NBAS subunit of NRZ tethering complex-like [Leguminivora glycinivorella]|uniref:LOW QUALITY PROTEIN: NBAS subunit of NRZ tethering complex-like n=1 Tax=Leguminivora glycinivorella TaxID=1035111 RepID=UPI00200BF292|nr:LOW QUALITY PROTEIN: NBAS subunit of NRZ tethering complex-like [Leguminivora glycinivorella]